MATTLAHKHFDGVKETTITVGVGDRVLGGAAVGYRTLATAGAVDGDVIPLSIRGPAEWEDGVYRYNAGANSVTPLEIHASSNANAVVNFSAGSKDVICGPLARHIIDPVPGFPFSTAQQLFRVNLLRSALTFNNRGYITQINDISGNGRHSAVSARPPRYVGRAGSLNGLPGAFFNGAHNWNFPTVPQSPAPLGICVFGIGSAWGAPSGNSHIYNYAGNPIGFSATTSLEFIYNGTLPTAHTDSQAIVQDQRPDGWLGHAVAFLHVYNGAASINGVNGVEQVVNVNIGTVASGASANGFVVGSDQTLAASFNRMILHEIGALNFVPTATQRGYLWSYLRAAGRLAFV